MMRICWRRQRKGFGVHAWRVFPSATHIVVIIMVATTSAAATTPASFRHAGLLMELPDDPAVISVMRVSVVENAVSVTAALIALGAVIMAVPLLGLCREDCNLLALGVFWLGLRRHRLRGAVHEEPSLLGLGALVVDLEDPYHGGQLVVHRELFLHLDVGDTHGERRDDFLVGDLKNLVAHLAEALDVLPKRLALNLAHRFEVVLCSGVLIRGHEIGDELLAYIPQEANDLGSKFISHVRAVCLRAIGNQLAMARWSLRAAWTMTM
jgi:hypothetical protein